MYRRKLSVISIVLMMLISTACIKKSACPNCSTETLFLLNTSSELSNDNKAHDTFFKDVGIAHRQGQLTDDDVVRLNIVGHVLQKSLQDANALYKDYVSDPTLDKKTRIITTLINISQTLASLTTTQTQMKLMHPTNAGGVK